MQNRLLALGMALVLGTAHAADLTTSNNPATGLTAWKQTDRGISLEIIQLSPEAAQATYSSRDLSPLIYESMRGYCVFGSVVRNETDAPLTYRVADWRVVNAGGKAQRLRTKSQWVADWKKQGVNFGWSILPDDITLEVGDWSLGYSPIKLSPGERFDLIYAWRQHEKSYTGTLQNLACPAAPGLR
ncbi:MAG: hypothetical protein HY273_04180 [Gammaproteobacteria bacterium]|nr:hypothetical protein [Gammaproteobacteria bacterium]